MADIELASLDLAARLPLKVLKVPQTLIEVTIKSAPADLVKAAKDGTVSLQLVIEAAIDSVKDARAEFRSALCELDEKLAKTPLTSEKDIAAALPGINTVYKQIAEAQKSVAIKAAEAAWDKIAKKDADLRKYNLKFAAEMAIGAISVAATVATAALSMGTLAISILHGLRTINKMAKTIIAYCRELDDVEADIVQTDKDLKDLWKSVAKSAAAEIATAFGASSISSVKLLEKQLKEHNAKNGANAKLAEKMWSETKDLLAKIEKLPDDKLPAMKENVKKLRTKATILFEQINELVAEGNKRDDFYADYMERLKTYKANEDAKGIGRVSQAAEAIRRISQIIEVGKDLEDVLEFFV